MYNGGLNMTKKTNYKYTKGLHLHWKIPQDLSLTFAIDNLLDKDFQTSVGFSGVGRFTRMGVAVEF